MEAPSCKAVVGDVVLVRCVDEFSTAFVFGLAAVVDADGNATDYHVMSTYSDRPLTCPIKPDATRWVVASARFEDPERFVRLAPNFRTFGEAQKYAAKFVRPEPKP